MTDYKLGTPEGGTQIVKGSQKLRDVARTPTKHMHLTNASSFIKKYLSKAGNTLKIAAKAPKISVPSILLGVGASYLGNKITNYVDGRTGESGKIPKKYLGTPTPKDTGKKRLTAKPNPVKKFTKEAYGGKVKKYASGGGIRKAQTYG
tara:strand:- start:580 stop:1023 length:444 start_codon:yes stop_codon:yes gene_type:complete